MNALLDTSVLVGLEQQRLALDAVPGSGAVSVLTLEELWLGVRMSEPALLPTRQLTYDRAVQVFPALPVDVPVARASADIRADGRSRGVRFGLADSLIGATARVHGLALYTQDPAMVGMLGVDLRVV